MLKMPDYYGLKTGITENAGPCLSAFYETDDYSFIIVLINSKSREARWEEVPQLVNWAKKQPKNRFESTNVSVNMFLLKKDMPPLPPK